MSSVPLLEYTSNPWGLPPHVRVSGRAVPGGTLPKLRVHVETRHDFDPYAPKDPWGRTREQTVSHPRTGGIFSVGDVLAYRKTWDAFVLDVIRAMKVCADALEAVGSGRAPPTPLSSVLANIATPETRKETLQRLADLKRADADLLLSEWNVHAGLSDYDIVLRAGFILTSQQKTVEHAGHFREVVHRDCPELALPDVPSVSLQAQLIGRVEGAQILAHGVLELFGIGLAGGLDTLGAIGQKAGKLVDVAANPWAVGGAIAAVAAALLLAYARPARVA